MKANKQVDDGAAVASIRWREIDFRYLIEYYGEMSATNLRQVVPAAPTLAQCHTREAHPPCPPCLMFFFFSILCASWSQRKGKKRWEVIVNLPGMI